MNNSQKIQIKNKIKIKHNKCRICGWDCEQDNWTACNDCIRYADSVGDFEKIRKWARNDSK